ncbi:MAG TPA: phosphotransferase [Bauldia sp.]|nr:phosphotransferase [Bauldia sp.]
MAEGGESRVYALDADRILRLLRRPRDVALLKRKQAFLAEIDGRLPFATPRIEAIGPGGAWTIERRLPGTSLRVLLRVLGGSERQAALLSYAESVDAIGTITFPDRPFGQILDEDPVTAGTWRGYLRLGLDRFIALNGTAITTVRGDLEALKASALNRLQDVAERPPKALVHGDYFPGNVLIGDDLRVSGLVDFSLWTLVGDPLIEVIGTPVFLEMSDEATPGDIAFVRRIILERHGDAVLRPARFYRAYFAFAMSDPGNSEGLYPKLWPWAMANLAALADGRLGF